MRAGWIGACLALGMSCAVAAPSIFDFDDWMQRVDDQSQDLQRHIAKRDLASASASAHELEDLYGRMEEFFSNRGTGESAVRWSREGREFAQRAQTELAGKRFESARRNALAIAHGCHDCHFKYKPL